MQILKSVTQKSYSFPVYQNGFFFSIYRDVDATVRFFGNNSNTLDSLV